LASTANITAGGKKILQRVAGKDASKQFWKYHNEGILKKYKAKLLVGSLDTKPKAEPKAEKPAPAPKPKPAQKAASAQPQEESEALEPFGAQIPFSDPSWYQNVRHHLFIVILSPFARP
jgi:cytochrome b involved in lipid metabolism